MNSTSNPDQLFGADVMTQDGKKIGSVDNVWVDDATSAAEFVGVKTGFFMGHTHIIPLADANVSDGSISVPYSEDQVKNAPHFAGDQELSPSDEDNVYSYYNLNRSDANSPTGLAAGEDTSGMTDTGYRGNRDLETSGTDGTEMTTASEELVAGKRTVEAGDVRLRKVVRTEHQEVPVELRSEEVQIERIPAGQGTTNVGDNVFQEQEIDVPVMAEEAVVDKRVVSTGGVRVNKDVQTQTENVGGDVRTEEVVVEGDGVDQTRLNRSNTNI